MIQELPFKKKNSILHNRKFRVIFLTIIVGFFLFAFLQVTNFARSSPINHIAVTPVSSRDHIRGNQNAPVTIVEYSDFECPECQYFQPTIKQILAAYGTDIRWVVRPYPLPQHINAEKEAEAAECVASLQGNNTYWKFSDALFSQETVTNDGTGFSLTKLPNLAQQMDIDTKKFTLCLSSGKFYKAIQQSVADAIKGGITQLPSTIIIDKRGNMQVISGDQPFGVYKSLIEQAIKE